jgi:NADH:ubiquinone oxidoreductase subunit 5 (subunit L)/multisubunit Na+/H+ antiporter MnhA subunit
MPVTAFTFIIGWLAIAGVPPFSGFWSKDEILVYAWNADAVGGKALWAVGLITAVLTAFYMTRQVILTFFGRTRFFDPTRYEIRDAMVARLEGARAGVQEAQEARKTAEEAVTKASADVTKRQDALTKAQTSLEEATASMAGSSEGDDGHDKLVKAFDKATKAIPKAESAVAKAQEKVEAEASAVNDAAELVVAAEGHLLEVENEVRSVPRFPAHVTALTEPVDIGPLADHLPESYHHRQETEPHESPATMTIPLMVLAVLAAVGGLLNLPFTKDLHFLEHWLEPSLFGHEAKLTATAGTKWALAIVAVLGGALAIFFSFRTYLQGKVDPATIERPGMTDAWWVDATYADFMGGPGRRLFDAMAWFDRTIVDGAVRGVAGVSQATGSVLRVLQPGFVRSYALSVGLGSIVILAWFVGRLFS